MDVKVYYQMIHSKASDIETAALDGKLPPTTFGTATTQHPITRTPQRTCTHVWLASQDNFEKNSQAGNISMVALKLAATRLVENTHRLATAEEVSAEKERQALQKDEHDRVEQLLNKKTQILVRPPKD